MAQVGSEQFSVGFEEEAFGLEEELLHLEDLGKQLFLLRGLLFFDAIGGDCGGPWRWGMVRYSCHCRKQIDGQYAPGLSLGPLGIGVLRAGYPNPRRTQHILQGRLLVASCVCCGGDVEGLAFCWSS